jgi:hypothetical protein
MAQGRSLVERRTVSLGETIFHEGTPSDHIYLIQSGIVRLERHEGNEWVEVARLGPNNVLGETALIERRVHSLRAIAETDVTLAVLSNEPFISALKQLDPAISVMLTGMVRKLEVATSLYVKLKAAGEQAQREAPAPVAAPSEPRHEEPQPAPEPPKPSAPPAASVPVPGPTAGHVFEGVALHHPDEYYSFAKLHHGEATEADLTPPPEPPKPFVPPWLHKKAMPTRWWQWALIAIVVVVGTYAFFGGFNMLGASEADFRGAFMALDETADTQGQTVATFLQCLANHGRGALDPPNPVSVSRGMNGDFQVRSNVRTDTIFHFLVRKRPVGNVAVMERVEYLVPGRGYAQSIDLDGKQLFATLACQ